MVRAKFVLQEVVESSYSRGKQLKFGAVTADEIPENRRFYEATPQGSLVMHVNNPTALDQFKLGAAYYLDFTEVPEVKEECG